MSTNCVELRGLTFSRGQRVILDSLDIDIPRGKITAILGPSGCGKTTLLRLIGSQLRPDQGSILFEGTDISRLRRQELFVLRERMGMLFQSGALFTDLSVFENVAFPLRLHTDLPESMIRDLVLIKLHAVGLRGARDLMPAELSGGMSRRAALARAIILDPELIMYDEPFVGQDPIFAGVLRDLIKRINEAMGCTCIIVSHDIAETVSISDYMYVLSEGRIIGQGAPDAVMNSDDARVRQFLQGLPDGPVPFHYPAPDYRSDLQLEEM
ncbi:MAG: ATP-binding cassette domain-containing protein [Gammaproteobacteria bacterium]|jgi:phospholipid/cholesterol/gamma-HCH transport system ATP-binding protein|nr:ATP-binding cassette domain-containing protein [Gammaproteobacteria bacterium]MDH5172037.1 ATP-binding cassette domain-containing protein [Gammaproteobacteria bacterium]